MNAEKDILNSRGLYAPSDRHDIYLILFKISYYTHSSDMMEKHHINSIITNQNEDEEAYDGLLKLFVGGLNYLSLQSDIKSYFETFGRVVNCTLLVDKSSGKSRGFAFVTIEDLCNY
jgi:RNA recognition motif-containing protein